MHKCLKFSVSIPSILYSHQLCQLYHQLDVHHRSEFDTVLPIYFDAMVCHVLPTKIGCVECCGFLQDWFNDFYKLINAFGYWSGSLSDLRNKYTFHNDICNVKSPNAIAYLWQFAVSGSYLLVLYHCTCWHSIDFWLPYHTIKIHVFYTLILGISCVLVMVVHWLNLFNASEKWWESEKKRADRKKEIERERQREREERRNKQTNNVSWPSILGLELVVVMRLKCTYHINKLSTIWAWMVLAAHSQWSRN